MKVNASGRLQSMQDNLLGNLDIGSIKDKFLGHGAGGSNPNPDPDTANELLALIQQKDLGGRPYYDGNPVASNGAYDAARAWDWDHGLTRTDWIDRSFGKVDPLASEDRDGNGTDEQMAYGTLNSNDRFNIVRHEGAGVELALKIKEFGPNGGDYSADHVKIGADGTAHFNVSAGASPDNANRADWSFDYAATVLPSGSDEAFTFKLKIDTDASEGVNLVEVPTQLTKGLFQNSSNLAFFKGLIDIDPATDGVQPYAFGEGEFTFVLEAYDGATKIAENKVVAHVGEAYWTA